MSSSSRSISPPGASRKRKESEDFCFLQPQPSAQDTKFAGAKSSGAARGGSNRLLAGYMAYEFLTKGTLFGEKFVPARAGAVPVSAVWRRLKVEQSQKREEQGYAEVASILKAEETHIPGIVNPTQLGRWIQM